MIEVFPRLFVGGADALLHADNGNDGVREGWQVLSAAKDPWHRQALGYTSRGAPKDDPEYLMARRDRRLYLNLIDPDDPAYIPAEVIIAGIAFIDGAMLAGDKVLVHCNQGKSRAPMIALLWSRFGTTAPLLHAYASRASFDEALDAFTEVYADLEPGKGILGFARAMWSGDTAGDDLADALARRDLP